MKMIPKQTQKQLAYALNVTRATISKRLHAMGKIQKERKWVPYALSDKQKENRKTSCQALIRLHQKQKILHRIVTGDEKWIYFDNPKRKRSWVGPGEPATLTPKRNLHVKKVLLCICIWWDQHGVLFYELLQPDETVTGERYEQQLNKLNNAIQQKRPEWSKRKSKVVFLHDNARPHVCKLVKETLKKLNWEVLAHPAYSPDVAPSDYYLFRSMAHGLSEQRFSKHEDVKKWLDEWISAKPDNFFYKGIHELPDKWQMVVNNDGNYSK